MATETQEIVPVDDVNEELVTSEKKVEYSVKSEVISTVKTHETVTYVTEVRTESETVENHVQEAIEGASSDEVKPIENGVAEENGVDKEEDEDKKAEEEKPKENGESEATSDEATPAVDVEAVVVVAEEPKVEAAVANGEEAAAETTETAEGTAETTTPEEEIEEEPPKVILHQMPRVKGIVSPSPQCLALETFLKMAKIPYENLYEEKAQDVTKENKGKIPYIQYKKTKVEGLKNCLKFLKKEFEVKVDEHLTKQEEAVAHAFRTMMEESTNWSLVYYRWVDNYGESKKAFSKLPPVINMVSPKMFQNKCKKSLESHVIGRHSREELYNIAEQDLCALSAFLDKKPFFLGDKPVTFDAIAFGLLANFDYGAEKSPQQALINERLPNLHAFCERMKENYWLDWDEICGEEKFQDKPAKPSLVKRLSFRSGNKKSKKPAAEGDKSEPTSPSEEKAAEGAEQQQEGEEAKENGEQPVQNGDTAENGTTENGEVEDKKETNAEEKGDADEEGDKNDEGQKDEGESKTE